MIFIYIIQILQITLRDLHKMFSIPSMPKIFKKLNRYNSIIIFAGDCEYCNKSVLDDDKHIKCYKTTCVFHKKCFKNMIKDTNNLAINLGYKAKFTKKNIHCKCGNGF